MKYLERGLSLLEQSGYVKRSNDGYQLTPEFGNIQYQATEQADEELGEDSPKEKFVYLALVKTILYKGPATDDEIYYMSETARLLIEAHADAIGITVNLV